MAEAIGYIIAFIIVYGIPYHLSKKADTHRREEMYNGLNEKQKSETDKWRR